MKLYIATPVNARPERTFKEKYIAAKHRVAVLIELIREDPQFGGSYDYVTSTFNVNALGEVSETEALGRCVSTVLECDAIYLDHGWQSSKGCNLEYRAAKIYGKTIYEHDKL